MHVLVLQLAEPFPSLNPISTCSWRPPRTPFTCNVIYNRLPACTIAYIRFTKRHPASVQSAPLLLVCFPVGH